MAAIRRIVSPHLGLFVLVGITMAISPRWVDAAEIFSCGEGGKPDVKTAKCICPPPKIEQTVGKKSSCVAPPPKVVTPPKVVPPAPIPPEPVAPEPPGVALGPRKAGSGAMVKIPGGTFQMGDNLEAESQPVHSVTVASFEMDETEVTLDAYKACVDDKGCSSTDLTGAECNWGVAGRGKHPMNCIDWTQSEAFCKWAGKRLPTEEEWEYAARKGAEGRTYPWGSPTPDSQLCWSKTSGGHTCAVGAYASTDDPWGLKDMAGNVWEWTASGWSTDYGKKRANEQRVVRGGGWFTDTGPDVRGASRGRHVGANRSSGLLGVRCAG